MLGFFRRLVKSRLGVVVTLGILAVIALAFALGDVSGVSMGGGVSGGTVATVGGEAVSSADLRRRAQDELEGLRQQNPSVDTAQFVSGGGVEAVLERVISGLAMDVFGRDQGLRVGKPLVDQQLASFPGLRGPTGQFDQALYERLLSQRRLTDAQVRGDLARDIMAQHLILPTVGASQVPEGLALPYASLLLERRAGQIAFIPIAAVGAGATPTAGELQGWYARNVARYALPERRVARYIQVSPGMVAAETTPSEAEIARTYQADRLKYQPSERRTIVQATVLDEAAANRLAQAVRGGQTVEAAARAAGLEARRIAGTDRAGYAGQSSQAAAEAAFGAQRGAVIGPVRAAIGFVVARVEAIEQVPGRTLAQVRGEIATALRQQKTADAVARRQEAIGTLIDDDSNLNEIAAAQKLTVAATPALTAGGVDPTGAGTAAPDPALAPIVAAAFSAAEGDAPQIVPTGADGSFAVVVLDRVVGAAPQPLAAVRERVATDFRIDRARATARRAASGVVQALGRRQPLDAALRGTGLTLPAVQSLDATRAQLAANPQGAQAPLVLLFSMAAGTAKMLEAPNNAGWFVVKLDRIVPGNAATRPNVIRATRGDLGRAIGREYVQQFTTAVRRAVGVRRNTEALDAVKRDLAGQGGSNP